MKHEEFKKLMVGYSDGKLRKDEEKVFETHLKACRECSKELKEFKKLMEVMNDMKYKEPEDKVWEGYWSSIYNRLERTIGWIFLSIGVIVLLFYGGFKLVEELIKDPTVTIIAKVGILALLAGLVILFVSVLRERVFAYKKDRYKEVKR